MTVKANDAADDTDDKNLIDTSLAVPEPEDAKPDVSLMTEDERRAFEDGDEDDEDLYEGEDNDDEEEGGEDDQPVIEPVDAGADGQPAAAAQPPENFTEKLAEIRAGIDEAKQKWSDGDLSDEDFQAAIAAAAKQEALIEFRAAEDDRSWNDAVRSYQTAFPSLWADEQVKTAFNEIVGDITASPRFASLPYPEQLALAHQRLATEAAYLNLPAVPAPQRNARPNKPAKPAAVQPDPKPAERAKPTPPPTLARLPASDTMSEADGRFAALDRLSKSGDVDGMERALARLSREERDAYGAGSDL